MEELTKIYSALSDKNRLRILILLSRKSLCVCELQAILKISVSTVSKHLSILKEAGFIIDEKDGKWVNYKINRLSKNPLIHQLLAATEVYLKDNHIVLDDLNKIIDVDRYEICSN
ncbi:MAG: metalloregulator ArsR/SmtB family transcription factor [Candidatus Kapabacteria bacterium]|nr:metalloregulator ArsR/SmtB family transcription factor [Candidatus Kapabacteria bacterium]